MGKYVKKMRLIFYFIFCVNKKKGELHNSNNNSF